MSGRSIAAGVMLLAALVMVESAPRAQTSGARRHLSDAARARILEQTGDGAEACAAAKTASALSMHRSAVSVATTNFDATYYHLNLTIGMDDDSIVGTVRIEGRVTNAALSQLTLDLASTMVVDSVKLPGGSALPFTHPGAALNITFPGPQAVGTLLAVDVTYRGIPLYSNFGNFFFGTHVGSRVAWSLSEPYGAREWWPCKDHPSDKVDSVRVTVTVPSEYKVGSQGLLVGETVNGANTTYDWLSHYPISNYLISVAIGKYVRYDDTYVRPPALVAEFGQPLSLPLVHLVYDDGSSALPSGWAESANALGLEESWFGPYPFATEKYGHSEFTFGGGMEHQTMTSIGGGAPSVVVHEMAHQWYGDCISPKRWKHLWLSEGFATYTESLWWEATNDTLVPGAADAVLDSRMAGARKAEGTLVLQDTTSVNNMFDGYRVYDKGAMVLHMLRYMVGDDTFRNILKAYAADPAVKYGNAVTDDFKRVAETVSGMNLSTFFKQWVTQGTGYPIYGATSTWKKEGGSYHVWVTLAQAQTEPLSNVNAFDMPVDIVLYANTPADTLAEMHRETVHNNQRSQVFEFHVASKPAQVVIDPDRHILRNEKITVMSQTLPPYPAIAALGPNPTRGNVQIQYLLDQNSRVDFQVFDVAGRRVMSIIVPNAPAGVQFYQLDTSHMASGVYFLRMSTKAGNAFKKFVVVR
ncbi:MAG TPA: M1 family aminopeptidase [Candidatus Krumholzibacteria bacterium]|nr:M1 family aminopeptidase [Candidatus Krumholzibacteria bacterium]